MPATTGDDWLSTPEAAAALGIGERTLYRLVDTGEIAAYRIGRVLRYRRADLDEFLEQHRVKPGELRNLYGTPGEEPEEPDEL